MTKAMELLRKIGQLGAKRDAQISLFDTRLEKLDAVQHVSVSRSVLFKTARSRKAA